MDLIPQQRIRSIYVYSTLVMFGVNYSTDLPNMWRRCVLGVIDNCSGCVLVRLDICKLRHSTTILLALRICLSEGIPTETPFNRIQQKLFCYRECLVLRIEVVHR